MIVTDENGVRKVKWVQLLKERGDSVEQIGVNNAGLGEKFPKYAEFWGYFVFPNRDPEDSMRLRKGFPEKYERIFNHHYGVFYQLTIALLQLDDLDNPILDSANPVYHLGTAADLVEKTFLAALRATGKLEVPQLTEEAFVAQVNRYWHNSYQGAYKSIH
ncbi:MAG TPA: hypothetical protein VK003_15745 [Oceanobacillus sp.]|nr:hypothetical protein [Oceanobacillus sp.]